ncbi:hypothetical protein LJC59_01300 [Desulfovibrio sp. OttesenSCG-928-A18]|nr:hypothetical protein [Desulfovibrio sp. OttesenSCG-928-A18]
MYLDKENMFSMAQAVTATALSTDLIDLGAGDIGPSEDISLFVHAGTAFTGAGTITVNVLTSGALNAAGNALDSAVTLASFPVSNAALLAGGKLVAARLPHGCQRYIRLNYTVSGTVADGTITAGLVADVQANDFVPTGNQ